MSKLSTIEERKRRAEEYYFQKFLSLNEGLKDCASSIPEGARAPDRIIVLDGRRIGIDLTGYFVDSRTSGSGGSGMRREEHDFESMVEAARSQFESKHRASLHVDFVKEQSFSFSPGKTRKQRAEIVDRIQGLVEAWLGSVDRIALQYHELAPYDLQHVFSLIMIDKMPEGFDSLWAMAGGGAIPHVENANLEAIINAKESKVQSYLSTCDDCWLLIHTVQNGGMSSWIQGEDTRELLSTSRFVTRFARVYFLSTNHDQLFSIPVTAPEHHVL